MAEVMLPNAVNEEADGVFKQRLQRVKDRPGAYADTVIFSKDGRNYIVGMEAERNTSSMRLTGPTKYQKGYIDILMLAALQRIVPDGSKNVIVAAARALNASAYTEAMTNALIGTHEIMDRNGKVVTYTVKAVIPWDEPVGGLARYQSRVESRADRRIQSGERVLVVDVGGRLSSMVPAVMTRSGEIEILWGEAYPIQTGIQNVMESLETEMRNTHAEIFQVHQIPTSILQEALMSEDNSAMIRGRAMNFQQEVSSASDPLLTTMSRAYKDRMRSGLEYSRIIITGGGGGLMNKALRRIFSHARVGLADTPDTINFANVRGAEAGLPGWISANNARIKANPVFMCMDTGNTAVKARKYGDPYEKSIY